MYRERVSFHPVVRIAYLLGIGALSLGHFRAVPAPAWITVAVGIPLLVLPLMFGRLSIRVADETLTVELGYLGWPIQRIPLTNIVGARVVSYRPIRQFGGWGIRAGRHDGEQTSVYTVRGTTGVLLELAEERRISGFRTRRFLIGSVDPDRPDRLAAALAGS